MSSEMSNIVAASVGQSVTSVNVATMRLILAQSGRGGHVH